MPESPADVVSHVLEMGHPFHRYYIHPLAFEHGFEVIKNIPRTGARC
jgi:hypothetical protein